MLEHPAITEMNRYGELRTWREVYNEEDYYSHKERIQRVKDDVFSWSENELDEGREPNYERFVSEYPEHEHEDFIDIIYDEIEAAIKRNDHYEPLKLKYEHERAMEDASTQTREYAESLT